MSAAPWTFTPLSSKKHDTIERSVAGWSPAGRPVMVRAVVLEVPTNAPGKDIVTTPPTVE